MMIKIIIKGIILLFTSGFILFFLFLGTIVLSDYKPEEIIPIEVVNNKNTILPNDKIITVTTYNIGYGGLDKNQDFFMDGGKSSKSRSEKQTLINTEKSLDFLLKEKSDFIFLQELDTKSSRSYDINQYAMFQENFDEYSSIFGWNYRVKWVPIPVLDPMGYVNSGISIFSKYTMDSGIRYQLPGKETWLKQLFMLDRCIIETSIPLDNGKELILVNLHLSAYDKGGRVREHQIRFLKNYITEKYQNNHYLIIGGDWNHLLTDEQFKDDESHKSWPSWLVELPNDFTQDGFHWAVDDTVLTVRDNRTEYIENESFTTIIDGFLVSPNIEIIDVYGHDLGFENSDHNPVTCKLKLK